MEFLPNKREIKQLQKRVSKRPTFEETIENLIIGSGKLKMNGYDFIPVKMVLRSYVDFYKQ